MRRFFTVGKPQANTNTQRISQGIQARTTKPVGWRSNCAAGPSSPLSLSWPRSLVVRQISFGFQTLRNSVRQAMEISAAPTSTSMGPWKLEIRNCGIAKVTPVTRIAGQIPLTPFQPAKAQISQNGTSTEKNGSCRPTIADSASSSRPVTLASVMTGVPSAPYATGAVFAIRDRPDAASGEKPSPMRIAPVTATGVPNPAAPSKKAPKAKAISSS